MAPWLGAWLAIEGMQVGWRVDDQGLVVHLEANSTGWIVFGFNDRDDIVGADLKFVREVAVTIAEMALAARHGVHVVVPADGLDPLRALTNEGPGRLVLAARRSTSGPQMMPPLSS